MAAEAWAKANELFVEEEYEEASKFYDEAIAKAPEKPLYYLHRASNNLKLKNYLDVISDCERSLNMHPGNAKAHLQKATAYFYMDEYESSHDAFSEAKALGSKKCDLWLRKCQAELRRERGDTSAAVMAPSPASPAPEVEATPAAPVVPAKVVPMAEKTKENWFQNNDGVQITLFAKGLAEEDVQVEVKEQEVHATLTFKDGSVFSRSWVLFASVQADAVNVRVRSVKVEINLKKTTTETWGGLERTAAPPAEVVRRDNTYADVQTATYPTSNPKTKDWNSVEKEVIKEEEEEKPEGQDALHSLFQKIYSNGTPETQRAMMKSFQTSAGTVLSTNWNEVEKTDYEDNIQAPKGQEVKKW